MCTTAYFLREVSSCILLFVAVGLDKREVAPPNKESGATAYKLTCYTCSIGVEI